MQGMDLAITRILNVYYASTDSWSRPRMIPRPMHGLILLTDGSISYHFADQTIIAKAYDILAFPCGLPYSGEVVTASQSFYVVDFETDPPDGFARMSLPCVLPGQEALTASFELMERAWREEAAESPLRLKAELYAILAHIVKGIRLGGQPASRSYAFTAYMRGHFQSPALTVASVAQHFNLSESQLRRIFTKEMGISPAQYIMQLRLKLAQNLLAYENLPVKEVAFRCGFGSEYYFSRLFKQKNGVPPSHYG